MNIKGIEVAQCFASSSSVSLKIAAMYLFPSQLVFAYILNESTYLSFPSNLCSEKIYLSSHLSVFT